MKFDCGPTPWEVFDAKQKWHSWFAWRPARIESHDCRWLEYVERKGTWHHIYMHSWWSWEYRSR